MFNCECVCVLAHIVCAPFQCTYTFYIHFAAAAAAAVVTVAAAAATTARYLFLSNTLCELFFFSLEVLVLVYFPFRIQFIPNHFFFCPRSIERFITLKYNLYRLLAPSIQINIFEYLEFNLIPY